MEKQPTAEKKPKSKLIKDFPPIEQWDQVAASMIYKELAPKGFKKYSNGHWKGVEHADIPFLSRNQVGQCQKIAAQLVRTFREEFKIGAEKYAEEVSNDIASDKKELDGLPFWKFGLKMKIKSDIERLEQYHAAIKLAITQADKVKVPSK